MRGVGDAMHRPELHPRVLRAEDVAAREACERNVVVAAKAHRAPRQTSAVDVLAQLGRAAVAGLVQQPPQRALVGPAAHLVADT